jgi:GDP-L-fucose synthase
LLENFDADTPINVGTGIDVKISKLALIISQITGFSGEITWNQSMPDGTPRKLLDCTLLGELGWHAKTDLWAGIEKTYKWFLNNFDIQK